MYKIETSTHNTFLLIIEQRKKFEFSYLMHEINVLTVELTWLFLVKQKKQQKQEKTKNKKKPKKKKNF